MTKRLIIAEKPSMAQSIANALPSKQKRGDGFIEVGNDIVTWCVGHIMRSYTPEEYNPRWGQWNIDDLPMIPEEWLIKVDSSKSKQFNVIKRLLRDCTEVINAGDPGREGQLIVDEVLFFLNNKKPVKRILLYALDEKSVRQAFEKLEDNQKYYNLYLAGVYRGYADWLMGMNATRAFTLKAQSQGYRGVLSVGRVQSPTLAIVVNRDNEIDNFKPKDYWLVYGVFQKDSKSFKAYWKNTNKGNIEVDSANRIINREHALALVRGLKGKSATVVKYEEKSGKEQQPLPFNLSSLQIYANNKWGMSVKRVLEVCQALYDKHKLQSYPRTDCRYLPENQFGDAPEILSNIANAISELSVAANSADTSIKSPAWNDKKLSEHYGLIPTTKKADLSLLNEDEIRIYTAVCQAYIAQFYPASEFKSIKIDLSCENELFSASGRVIEKAGWKQVFTDNQEEKENEDEEDQLLPVLSESEQVDCVDMVSQDKKTTPPPRFNQGSLIKAMTSVHTLVDDPNMKKILREKKGIGQEATRTQIIESLFKRKLIESKGKNVISTDAGKALVAALPASVINPALTAVWEDALDKIANGSLSVEKFRENQVNWVKKLVNDAKSTQIAEIKSPPKNRDRKEVGPCPKCETGTLYENRLKNKKRVIGCSNWNKEPKCDYSKWL